MKNTNRFAIRRGRIFRIFDEISEISGDAVVFVAPAAPQNRHAAGPMAADIVKPGQLWAGDRRPST